MNNFIDLLYTLESQDSELIHTIISGYDTIFESFTDVSTSVLKAYNRLLNISISDVDLTHNGYAIINIPLDDTEVIFQITVGRNMECKAFYPNIVLMKISDVLFTLMKHDINAFKQQISRTNIRHAILHELGHVYEYSKRDKNNTTEQLKRLNDLYADTEPSDVEYHNHRSEKLANYTSTVLYRILDAVKSNIQDPNEMYKFVISKLEQDAANTDHLATSIRSLNNKHKNKLYKRIANIINELNNAHESDLKTITRIVSNELKDD